MGILNWMFERPRERGAPTLQRTREVQREFTTKVAGVSFDNDDGSSREAAIRRLKVGDPLDLLPDPQNAYDPHAIKVVSRRLRVQIGHVGANVARRLGDQMAEGGGADAVVVEIMPGSGDASWGVAIQVRIY